MESKPFGLVNLDSDLVKVESLAKESHPKSRLLIMCAVCNKIKFGPFWLNRGNLLYSLLLYMHNGKVSRKYCPPDVQRERERFEKWLTSSEEYRGVSSHY